MSIFNIIRGFFPGYRTRVVGMTANGDWDYKALVLHESWFFLGSGYKWKVTEYSSKTGIAWYDSETKVQISFLSYLSRELEAISKSMREFKEKERVFSWPDAAAIWRLHNENGGKHDGTS